MNPEQYYTAEKVKRLFSSPLHMPQEFKSWMVDQMVLNIPDLPVKQAFQGRSLAKQLAHAATAVTATATTETTIFSFKLPKGALSQNGRLVINQHLDISCADGSNACHVYLYMGGVQIAELAYLTAFLDGTLYTSPIQWTIQNRNSYASQLVYAFFWLPLTGTYLGTGSGGIMPNTSIDTAAAELTVEGRVRWDSGGTQQFVHRDAIANLYNPVRFK